MKNVLILDFPAQIKQFLVAVLPDRAWELSRMPALKWELIFGIASEEAGTWGISYLRVTGMFSPTHWAELLGLSWAKLCRTRDRKD